MRINNVVGYSNAVIGRNIAFERRLKDYETKGYVDARKAGMDYLGVETFALILHGPSFPRRSKNEVQAPIGSPYGNEKLWKFLDLHGLQIQQGPTGKLKRGDNSPYSSSLFAKNPLYIDFNLLKSKDYASILSDEDLKEFNRPEEKTNDNYVMANYKEANRMVNNLTARAYDNYINKLESGDSAVQELRAEFNKFKEKNDNTWLDYYSVLDKIAESYGSDDFHDWSDEDASLIRGVKNKDQTAISRYNQFKQENEYDIEKYKFTQFIIDKQVREDIKNRGNIVYIGDMLVGVHPFEELVFEDAFLDGWRIGAENGGLLNSPQLWNVPVVNPDKLYNDDGSLGAAGEFLKLKIQRVFQDSSNVRIDNAFGVVNPYVYKSDSVKMIKATEGNKEYVIPDKKSLKAGYMSDVEIKGKDNFKRVIPKIIIPTLHEMGVDPKDAVWEALGNDKDGMFDEIKKRHNLPGMTVLLWDRGENAPKENWALAGGHDNKPLKTTVKEKFCSLENAWHPDYLAGYLNPLDEQARAKYKEGITSSPCKLWFAKLTELFRSTSKIQISFLDFFGINKPYNVPGTFSDENWSVGLTEDWEDKYYKALESDGDDAKHWAMNVPEVIAAAVDAKAQMDIRDASPEEKAQIRTKTDKIKNDLNKYAKIFKEKE